MARRFAREGYTACVTRRTMEKLEPLLAQIRQAGGTAHGFGSDARKEDEVVALVEHIEHDIGPIEVMVFNIGANSPNSILTETAQRYTKIWEMSCLAGFLTGREVAKRMIARAESGSSQDRGVRTEAPSSSLAQALRSGAAQILLALRAAKWPCVAWPRAWRVSSAPEASMWLTPSLTAQLIRSSYAASFLSAMP